MRRDIEKAFADGDVRINVFDKAKSEVFEMMFYQLYPGFLKQHPEIRELVQIGAVTRHGVVLSSSESGVRPRSQSFTATTSSHTMLEAKGRTERFLEGEERRANRLGRWIRRLTLSNSNKDTKRRVILLTLPLAIQH